MDPVISTALLIFALPLVSYVLLFLFGEKLPHRGDWLGIGLLGVCWVLSLKIFWEFWGVNDPSHQIEQNWNWFTIGTFSVDFGILVDGMTAVMLVVVTTVSFLVHLFSSGYMAGDRRYARYFAFLGWFTFSMLGIVLSNSLFFLYIFWELVGVASYVLIGFFFHKNSAADANKKAFLVNRVGDLGFWLGILIFFTAIGSFNYNELFQGVAAGGLQGGLLTAAGILLFMGAVGKSAQMPLHVWLPDAMEGPTPVSALIHAATMVAAGVYMTARLLPLFSPDALLLVAYVGAITAIFAATIAIVQTDIKRGLAYSTLSQLGYMVMAVGVGSATAGMFHLTTHAFFKACLFLGSGAVIHAMHHQQDMRHMGGLRHKMPVTFAAMLVSTIAISGVPPFSGFWSKDAVLGAALAFGMEHPAHYAPFVMALLAAVITGFYMFRIVFMTFFGKPRDQHAYDHAHEVDWRMATPLVVLGFLAVVGGGFPGLGFNWFDRFVAEPRVQVVTDAHAYETGHGATGTVQLGGTVADQHAGGAVADEHAPDPHGEESLVGATEVGGTHEADPHAADDTHAAGAGDHGDGHHDIHHIAHERAMIMSLFAAGLGILLSWLFYIRRRFHSEAVQAAFPEIHRTLENKYWFDEFYRDHVVANVLRLAKFSGGVDKYLVDGLVNGVGYVTRFAGDVSGHLDRLFVDGLVNAIGDVLRGFGSMVSSWQTGRVQNYFLGLVGGLVVLILVYRTVWLG
jgi:NADH-quinone oxidoreductase subunit L